ncbi:aspartyl-phosphate phosphatase Spo0E family protein [Bacillus sp. CGMCC 1.16607]|uniref:aspartyl-phosphate phosphatase Spo0E family protein n=1 Tax=Bacillus sp. CGMCC 1.16607 TaxID=3351842 RepID=UPI00364051D1
MNLFLLEQEINSLRLYLYELAKNADSYSQGEILNVSQQLDQKVLLYQKCLIEKLENKYVGNK